MAPRRWYHRSRCCLFQHCVRRQKMRRRILRARERIFGYERAHALARQRRTYAAAQPRPAAARACSRPSRVPSARDRRSMSLCCLQAAPRTSVLLRPWSLPQRLGSSGTCARPRVVKGRATPPADSRGGRDTKGRSNPPVTTVVRAHVLRPALELCLRCGTAGNRRTVT